MTAPGAGSGGEGANGPMPHDPSATLGPHPLEDMAKITLRANFHRERSQWIGWCPDLDVTTQGATRREAAENLLEAVALFLETCQEMGTLEEVLREAGLLPIPEATTFEVPWPLLKDTRSDTRASTPSR